MKIIFTPLSQQYLESCIECAFYSNIYNDPVTTNFQLSKEYDYQILQRELSDKESFKTTLLAIDLDNNNKVVACMPGMDIVLHEDPKENPYTNKKKQDFCEFEWSLIQSIYQQYKDKKNQIIVLDNYSVLPEYQGKGLGQKLVYEFTKYAFSLGYQFILGTCYNQISKHIFQKFNYQIIKSINLANLKLDNEYPLKNLTNGCDLIWQDIKDSIKIIDQVKFSYQI